MECLGTETKAHSAEDGRRLPILRLRCIPARRRRDVYSSFGGFVFDEGGYFEGGYEGGSFGDDGAGG